MLMIRRKVIATTEEFAVKAPLDYATLRSVVRSVTLAMPEYLRDDDTALHPERSVLTDA